MRRRYIALAPAAAMIAFVAACNALTGAGDFAANGDDASSPNPSKPTVNDGSVVGDGGVTQNGPDGSTQPPKDSGTILVDGSNPIDANPPPPNTYAAMILGDAPSAYWRLDEPAGAATLHDATGHGNDLTVANKGNSVISFQQPGAISGDPDTCVELPGSSSLVIGDKFEFGSSPYSIEAWVLPAASGKYRYIFSKMLYTSAGQPMTGMYIFLFDPLGTIGFERYTVSTSATQAVSAAQPVSTSFQHIVATSDGQTAIIYVNGVAGGSAKAGTNPPVSTLATLGDVLQGKLDEVAIYPTALSAAQVSAHYAKGTGAK